MGLINLNAEWAKQKTRVLYGDIELFDSRGLSRTSTTPATRAFTKNALARNLEGDTKVSLYHIKKTYADISKTLDAIQKREGFSPQDPQYKMVSGAFTLILDTLDGEDYLDANRALPQGEVLDLNAV